MDDNRVLSGARQQHLMSQKLDQAFHSFIHDYYTYRYDSNYSPPYRTYYTCSWVLINTVSRIYWLET
jgi:hypothetical protein